jgi:hypothetical protein
MAEKSLRRNKPKNTNSQQEQNRPGGWELFEPGAPILLFHGMAANMNLLDTPLFELHRKRDRTTMKLATVASFPEIRRE